MECLACSHVLPPCSPTFSMAVRISFLTVPAMLCKLAFALRVHGCLHELCHTCLHAPTCTFHVLTSISTCVSGRQKHLCTQNFGGVVHLPSHMKSQQTLVMAAATRCVRCGSPPTASLTWSVVPAAASVPPASCCCCCCAVMP